MRTPYNERLTPDIAELAGSGRDDRASGSDRRCLLSGKTGAREQLLRLAISPDGAVLPDPAAKAPGRGAWIAPDRAALETMLADGHFKKALMRAFKGANLTIPEDLPDRIEAALKRSLTERLGLELRAGNLVIGAARIEEHARAGRLSLLLHADDSNADGRKKLDQAWRVGRCAEGSGERGLVLPLDRAALSVALGRENVVHLGVMAAKNGQAADTGAAVRVSQAIFRLSSFVTNGDRVRPGCSDQPTTDEARPVPRSASSNVGNDLMNT